MDWKWDCTDEGRVKRAKSVKFRDITLEPEPAGYAIGHSADEYYVTLESCTCADFAICGAKSDLQPCKHMIALAMKAGLVNENGLTPPQQKAADIASLRLRIALAYGFFYHFDDPIMSDKEYDLMKDKLAELEDSNNYDGL